VAGRGSDYSPAAFAFSNEAGCSKHGGKNLWKIGNFKLTHYPISGSDLI